MSNAADVHVVMEPRTSTSATVLKTNASVIVVAQASNQVTIDSSKLTAIWLLLAVLGVVLAWALFELRRRRKMALRLDRLGGLTVTPRYPSANTHSKACGATSTLSKTSNSSPSTSR